MEDVNRDQIIKRLVPVFPQEQAEVLVDLVEEVRSGQVTREDFTELKDLVRDLAIAQNELAGAQQRTEQRVEQLAEAQQRTEQRVEQLAEAQQKTEVALHQLARQVGGLSETVGANLEDLACDIVPELLEKHWGMEVDSAEPEELGVGGETYPYDLVVRGKVNGRSVLVLGETKSNVTLTEVEKFSKNVERFARTHSGPEIRMVFFGFRADRAAKERIQELGASMVFSRGVLFPPV